LSLIRLRETEADDTRARFEEQGMKERMKDEGGRMKEE
jgi:hypothetical protein